MLGSILKSCIAFILIGLHSLTAYALSCDPSPLAIRSAPDNRYIIISDGTEVKDKRTGLIWQRCAIGQNFDGKQCAGRPDVYSWNNLLNLDKNLAKGTRVDKNLAKTYRVNDTLDSNGRRSDNSFNNGHRVPTIQELETLVETACPEIAINTTLFPNTGHTFRSSTEIPNDKEYALSLLFLNDFKGTRYKHLKQAIFGNIRLVRNE